MGGYPLILSIGVRNCKIMKEIIIESFAKINLSIDVGEVLPDGFHVVDMVMQQLAFHDDVKIGWEQDLDKKNGDIDISLSTNRYYLPTDKRNLAYRATMLIIEKYGYRLPGGKLTISIFKRIPVAAGLGGGSGNGAAVLHGLNKLWNLNLTMKQLCDIGKQLGSDVPFCIMGQGKSCRNLSKGIKKDNLSTSAARAIGTGTILEPICGINSYVVLVKPPIGVSTKEVYKGIDKCTIKQRPNNDRLVKCLANGQYQEAFEEMINVLENYTLKEYPVVKNIINILMEEQNTKKVLMSGSGPTVLAFFSKIEDAKDVCKKMRDLKYEAYWTKTIK